MTLLINGSAASSSTNGNFLQALSKRYTSASELQIYPTEGLLHLPLYSPDIDQPDQLSQSVLNWRSSVSRAQSVILSTPVYIYNIPALLKNALEWLTTSGELYGKPVFVFTYTPHPPRGDKAMASLIPSLQALNAQILGQCQLYQSELFIRDNFDLEGEESIVLLDEAMSMLGHNKLS